MVWHDSKTLLQLLLSADARIDALTAERDRAEDELYELQQTCITLRGENEALTAERDRLKAFVWAALDAWDIQDKDGGPMGDHWVSDARAALKGETP